MSSSTVESNNEPPVAPDGAPAVPRDTSPTWELEMLISGGVVFSLFQLPPLVDALAARWEPHATQPAMIGLILGYTYVKSALYTLIAAFVIHLCARAYWVGLMGLNSVFPNGINWDRANLGPLTQEVYRRRLPAVPSLISTIDNFASVIFSFAFLIVLMFVVSVPLMLIFGGIAFLISRYLLGGDGFKAVFLVIGAVMSIVPISLALFDLKRGKTIPGNSPTASRLRRIISFLYTTQLVGLTGPTLFTIGTNSRRKTVYALFYIVFLGSMLSVMMEYVIRKGVFTMNGADYFTEGSDTHSLNFNAYESQWEDGYVNRAAPSIQSDVIREQYIRLFIPYQPPRHNSGIAERCPGIPPLQKRGLSVARADTGAAAEAAADSVLRCLARIHDIQINGERQQDVHLRFASHPKTGVDGMVAYLRVDSLPRGENILRVMPPPRSSTSKNRRPLRPYIIPFWL